MTDYSDQEELEKLKAWWKNYGNALIFGVLLGVAIIAGNKYWQQYTGRQALAAFTLYESVLQASRENRRDSVREMVKKLVADFSSTPYAAMATLILARMSFEAGETEDARTQLTWVEKNAGDPAVRHAARLRLARLMAEKGETDAALSLLNVTNRDGFSGEYEELRGDILLSRGDRDGAREAYRAALVAVSPQSFYIPVLRMKLENVGGENAQ